MSLKVLCVGDIHFTVDHPISRDENYPKDILKKIVECIQIAKAKNCDYILCTGDWFHRKSQATFYEANLLMAMFKKSHIPIYGIAGNHDIAGYNLKTLNSRALGSLITSGHLRLLDNHQIDKDGVLVTGTSFNRMYDVGRMAYCKAETQEDRYTLTITHGSLILKPDGTFFGQYTNMNDLTKLNQPLCNIIFNGHVHHNQGTYLLKDQNCSVFSIGSLSRNILKEDVANRKPSVLFLDIKEGSFSCEEIELKSARDFKDAFIQRKPEDLKDKSSIEDFIDTLVSESGDMAMLDDKEIIKNTIKRLGYSKEIEEKVLTYVDQGDQ